MFLSLNVVAILVASILAAAVESIWYSPLIGGTLWKRTAGLVQYTEDVSTLHMIRTTIQAVFVYILFFGVAMQIMQVMGNQQTFLQSVALLYALVVVSLVAVARREYRAWSYIALHASFSAVILFGGLGILMYWPW